MNDVQEKVSEPLQDSPELPDLLVEPDPGKLGFLSVVDRIGAPGGYGGIIE